jgi:hypothetical protein
MPIIPQTQKRQYFQTIVTEGNKPQDVARIHNEKITNYIYFDWPAPNSELGERPEIPYEREVDQMNTTSCVRNDGHTFVLTSVFCCHDEEENHDESKERY